LTLVRCERSTPKAFASQLRPSPRGEESLDRPGHRRQLTHLSRTVMARVCSITGSKVTRGSV